MKIAIASTTKDLSGEISGLGGRAAYYLLIDENGKLLETINNPFTGGSGKAGFAVAKILAEKEVDKLIAGRIGDNMQKILEEKKIEYESAAGLIQDYLK